MKDNPFYAELQKKHALLVRKYNTLLSGAIKNRNALIRLYKNHILLKKKYISLRKYSTQKITNYIEHINNEKYHVVINEYKKIEKISTQFLQEIGMTREEFENSMYIDILFQKYLPQPDRTISSSEIEPFNFPILLNEYEQDTGELYPFVHFTIHGKIEKAPKQQHFCYFLNIENISSTIELDYFQKTDSLYQSLSVANFKLLNAKKTIEMHKRMLLSLTCSLINEYSKETSKHLKNMETLTGYLTQECARMGLIEVENYDRDEYIKDINYTSVLHDIGKMAIPSSILEKEDCLTDIEHETMKSHPQVGGEYIKRIIDVFADDPEYSQYCNFLQIPWEICRYHHERWDGKGYPEGLSSQAIPIAARIISVVDTYEALRGERAYNHQKKTHEEAVSIIRNEAGTQFDPKIVEAFLNIHFKFESYLA